MIFALLFAACMSQLEADCRSSCELYWSTCMNAVNASGEPDPIASDKYADACAEECPALAVESQRETEDWTACVDSHRAEIEEYEADDESCSAVESACDPGELFTPILDESGQ
jgi:hypothetical protein